MDRFLVPAALVGMGLLIYFFLADGAQQHPAPPQVRDAMAQAPHRPLPTLEVDAELPDVGPVVDAALTVDRVNDIGLLGREARWLDPVMANHLDWRKVPDAEEPTWIGFNDVRLTFHVDHGRVTGAKAVFAKGALSASLTALSSELVGYRDFLPVHMEVMGREEAMIPRQGSYVDGRGRRGYYRGTFDTQGDSSIFGPAEFEVSMTPFPPNPEARPLPPPAGMVLVDGGIQDVP